LHGGIVLFARCSQKQRGDQNYPMQPQNEMTFHHEN